MQLFQVLPDPEVGVNQYKLNSSPTVWGKILMIGMSRGGVYAYNADSGKPMWTFKTAKAPVHSSVGVAAKSGLAYFGCNDGKLYCVDAKTGVKKWEQPIGNKILSSPWPGNGVVYIGSDDGHIYALE